MDIDLNKIDNFSFDGVNHNDYPDYADVYLESADYEDRELTDEEIDFINDEHWDFVYEQFINQLF